MRVSSVDKSPDVSTQGISTQNLFKLLPITQASFILIRKFVSDYILLGLTLIEKIRSKMLTQVDETDIILLDAIKSIHITDAAKIIVRIALKYS